MPPAVSLFLCASGKQVDSELRARSTASSPPFRYLPFVRGGEVGSSLRRLARADVCRAGPHGPKVFDLPWPLLTKEGDGGVWVASSRGDEIVLVSSAKQEAHCFIEWLLHSSDGLIVRHDAESPGPKVTPSDPQLKVKAKKCIMVFLNSPDTCPASGPRFCETDKSPI